MSKIPGCVRHIMTRYRVSSKQAIQYLKKVEVYQGIRLECISIPFIDSWSFEQFANFVDLLFALVERELCKVGDYATEDGFHSDIVGRIFWNKPLKNSAHNKALGGEATFWRICGKTLVPDFITIIAREKRDMLDPQTFIDTLYDVERPFLLKITTRERVNLKGAIQNIARSKPEDAMSMFSSHPESAELFILHKMPVVEVNLLPADIRDFMMFWNAYRGRPRNERFELARAQYRNAIVTRLTALTTVLKQKMPNQKDLHEQRQVLKKKIRMLDKFEPLLKKILIG